jgi:hypothetical protein
MRRRLLFGAALAAVATIVACGSSDDAADGTGPGGVRGDGGADGGSSSTTPGESKPPPVEIAFHGQTEALPEFTFDTGWQPPGSPVQLRFVASTASKLTADAKALAGGAYATPQVVGIPASGLFAMDVHVTLTTSMKIDIPGVQFEGPLQNVPQIQIAFAGQSNFDPFLIGGKVETTGTQPNDTLITIPLPNAINIPGISGQLVLSGGGTLTATFTGVCAAALDGKVSYDGATSTTGALFINPGLQITGPLGFKKKIDTFTIPFDVGPFQGNLFLGERSVPPDHAPPPTPTVSTDRATTGTCAAASQAPPK